jgi:hypothetical protein
MHRIARNPEHHAIWLATICKLFDPYYPLEPVAPAVHGVSEAKRVLREPPSLSVYINNGHGELPLVMSSLAIRVIVAFSLATLILASPVARQASLCPWNGVPNASNFTLLSVSKTETSVQKPLALGSNGLPAPSSVAWLGVFTLFFSVASREINETVLTSYIWNAECRVHRFNCCPELRFGRRRDHRIRFGRGPGRCFEPGGERERRVIVPSPRRENDGCSC